MKDRIQKQNSSTFQHKMSSSKDKKLAGMELPRCLLTSSSRQETVPRLQMLSPSDRFLSYHEQWFAKIGEHRLQALVYDILPSTTAIFSYTIGPRKLSTDKQFFGGAQTVGSLLQTTQIISDVCFL